jgi:hypothetical protein
MEQKSIKHSHSKARTLIEKKINMTHYHPLRLMTLKRRKVFFVWDVDGKKI